MTLRTLMRQAQGQAARLRRSSGSAIVVSRTMNDRKRIVICLDGTWQTMLVYRSPEVQIKSGPRMVADLQIKQLT